MSEKKTLWAAMGEFEEGQHAHWIDQFLYDWKHKLEDMDKEIPERLRTMRAYFEKIAVAKLRERAKGEFEWLWELALKDAATAKKEEVPA